MSAARIVVLENQADDGAATALQWRVTAAFESGHRAIVLDLRGAVVAGTSTVSELCCALRHVARDDATITVLGGPPQLRRVLDLCDISGVVAASTDACGPALPSAPRPTPRSERNTVEIPKAKILDLLHQQGKSPQADQAEQELPDKVDPERDAGLLEKFGIEPQDVLAKLGGGIPGL